MIQEFLSTVIGKIATGIVAVSMAIGSLFGINQATQDFGATVPIVVASFSTTLAAEITSTATSMTLTSGTTDDSTTLNGTYGFVIDSGVSGKEEFVLATCVDTACTSMTRGVSSITGNTAVTALKHAHSRGASVKISDHPQLAIVSRIVNGDEAFPNLLSYDLTSVVSPSGAYDITTKKYVDDTVSAGAADASTTVKGIVEEATDAELQAGTAAGGTSARLFAGGASHTQTPTANKVPVALSTGLLDDGWLGLGSAGDMLFSDGSVLDTVTIGNANTWLYSDGSRPYWGGTNLSEANTAFGSTDISGAELEDLSDAGSTILHSHPMGAGQTTRDMGAGTGTQNIAHGLGRVPSLIKITAFLGDPDGGTATEGAMSVGSSLGLTGETATSYYDSGSAHGITQNSSAIIYIEDAAATTDVVIADISAVDATNFTLNFTTVGTLQANDDLYIQWEAF